jgi:serine/threonine protein kinase
MDLSAAARRPVPTPEQTSPGGNKKASKGLVYKGKWKVLHPLTETDRSYVFLGTPLQGGNPVAIKVLKERKAKDSRFMKIHNADMQAAVALPRHPGLVSTFDAGWINGRYVVVSEFCPGEPLSGRLNKPRPIPYPSILAAIRQLVGVLKFAVDSGILYRHVEPEHLIFEEETRQMRLLRFSIPRAVRLGIQVPRGIDQDIHLVGSLLFRMLCGAQPSSRLREQAELLVDQLRQRCAAVYPEVNPSELHELATIYLRTATRDQRRRFTAFQQLDEELARLERNHKPLQEERERAERERRRESLLATAFDTVRALRGEHDARPQFDLDDADLREIRIQRFLLAATTLMFLSLAVSLFW